MSVSALERLGHPSMGGILHCLELFAEHGLGDNIQSVVEGYEILISMTVRLCEGLEWNAYQFD